MVRKAGPDRYRAGLIRDEIKAAGGPIYIRELARHLAGVMSYRTVWRYVREFMPEVRLEYRYGPGGDFMVFLEVCD